MLTYVSLFSSAGVGCYGVSQNGYSCVATAELHEKRINIQRVNNKCSLETGYICGDLTKKEIKTQLIDEVNSYKKKNKIKELDLLIATPPCQGMSVANHKKKNELSRNSLIVESLKITSELKPKFFIFENVASFLKSICTDTDGVDKNIHQAIERNLAGEYSIAYDVVNFKSYGSPSSRTRSLVIGVRKDFQEITPLELFPDYQEERTLRQVVGNMESLSIMGNSSINDIYHNFRPYKEHMREWIRYLKEGESAFDNNDDKQKPHQIIDGCLIVNKNKNGDKYKRQSWDKVGACIHTRNDIMASQNTVHPVDDRVFSIRELMKLMTIPISFKWANQSLEELNLLTDEEKKSYLKKNEMNIRQCIGEAVPTIIFSQISRKIKSHLHNRKILSRKDITLLVENHELYDNKNLIVFLEEKLDYYSLNNLFKIAELANCERDQTAAFYTRQDICYSLIKDLPSFSQQKSISILEPSVGVGNFIPLLVKKYQDKELITIDMVDINSDSLKILKILIKKMNLQKNVKINFIHDDFLLHDFDKIYDVTIGNPPYGKVTKKPKLLAQYKKNVTNKKTNNIFSYFIEKSMQLSLHCALIVPKSLLSSPEYEGTKSMLESKKIIKINDYNEKAFDVKIETIGFIVDIKAKLSKNHLVEIESFLLKKTLFQHQKYITDNQFNTWLLYRNDFFDTILSKLTFNVFQAFRDRQITKKHLRDNGTVRVLKSRNIDNNNIMNIIGYDRYISNIEEFGVSKYLNTKNAILVPNLTYNPRAVFLPADCIADGSVAILTLREECDIQITQKNLEYFASDEFRLFYKIARNYGTRSLNIDNNSVKFFGISKI